MTVSWLDVPLLLLMATYAVIGYRHGLVISCLSIAGFLGGGALGIWVATNVVLTGDVLAHDPPLRAVIYVLCVFVGATLGQSVAIMVGNALRRRIRAPRVRTVEAYLGSIVAVVAVASLAWFVAGSLRSSVTPHMARAIGQSATLRAIDGVMPDDAGRVVAGLRRTLDRQGFPQVFDGLAVEPIRPAEPPDPNVVRSPGVTRAAGSIVKITGIARACRTGQEGSGWVLSKGRVVTNAHVVAGLREVSVRVRGTGPAFEGRVVVFDPKRDLAVLHVPDLPAPALRSGSALEAGDQGVVAGFPHNGPYRLDAARVRHIVQARGSDIYGQSGAVREVYSLLARVRPGNSGGPLLDTRGRVVGVVFAKSLDDDTTGYALTMREASPVLAKGRTVADAVSTGTCQTH